jgi:hypothetical protein
VFRALVNNVLAATVVMIVVAAALWILGRMISPLTVPFLLVAYPLIMIVVIRRWLPD